MRTKLLHIIFLAFLHLLVFMYPTAIKLAHHHISEGRSLVHQQGETVVKGEKPCLVCDFEFVTFINREPVNHWVVRDVSFFKRYEFEQPEYTSEFAWYSLRAPPAFI